MARILASIVSSIALASMRQVSPGLLNYGPWLPWDRLITEVPGNALATGWIGLITQSDNNLDFFVQKTQSDAL
jgi:hypothetical protein